MPIVNGLEAEYASIKFYRFDANAPANQGIQNDLQLRGHPSVALISEDGEVVGRFFGSQPAERLKPELDELVR